MTDNPKKEDILEEALRLTSGDRQNQYGPPDQDFARTAAMWSALFAHKMTDPFESRDVAMAMICLKLSRETHQRKRDNAVDGAGYFRCLHLCNEAHGDTGKKSAPAEENSKTTSSTDGDALRATIDALRKERDLWRDEAERWRKIDTRENLLSENAGSDAPGANE